MYHDCRMGGAFVPDLEGKFLATENFFHTSKVSASPYFPPSLGYLVFRKV
jgi:hypothetical protein